LQPEDIKIISLEAIWNFSKQVSHELIKGTKGPSIKVYMHRDREVSKPIVNRSINQLEVYTPTRYSGEDV
jgi:hypothetical protein